MSGASPKHTKSRGHKTCPGSCANSCHQEGTGNLGGWVNLGQTGCLTTYAHHRYCLSPVQTQAPQGARDPPHLNHRQAGGAAPQPASRDRLQTSPALPREPRGLSDEEECPCTPRPSPPAPTPEWSRPQSHPLQRELLLTLPSISIC